MLRLPGMPRMGVGNSGINCGYFGLVVGEVHQTMKSSKNQQAGAGAGAGRACHLPLVRPPLQGPYSGLYGSDMVAARYCGFRKPPSAPLGLWMHGWYPERRPLDRADLLFGVTMAHLREERYWVATERQAKVLRSLGFSRSRAIGLPMVYAPEPQIAREKGALLVMPAHSLPNSSHGWVVSEYVKSISALRPCFRKICVCINGHDWTKGEWVQDFRDAGFEVVRGAGDNSSLDRMASLFAQFEFVTSNGFGSLVAYASAFGAKVSLYGPFAEVTPDSLKNVPYFVDNPDLLASEAAYVGERYCREQFPEIFVHPADATERIEWGRAEMGWQNKVSPRELRQLFGWSTWGRTRSRVTSSVARARAAVPQPLRTQVKEVLRPQLRSDRLERRRLESMGTEESGSTPLFGRAFEFADSKAYLQAHADCFVRQVYRFRGTSDQPFIIDGCAGVGLSVLYFKCLYPRCRVLAVEAGRAAFALLERNCRTYGLEEVELVQGDFWGEVVPSRFVEDSSSSAGPGSHDKAPPSSASRLEPDRGHIERIDLLKVEMDGSQAARLGTVAGLLTRAESVSVDYRSRVGEPQGLGSLLDVLEDVGFRCSVESLDSTRGQPLVDIPGARAVDSHLRIMGVRM